MKIKMLSKYHFIDYIAKKKAMQAKSKAVDFTATPAAFVKIILPLDLPFMV